jgi:hypothetical protein
MWRACTRCGLVFVASISYACGSDESSVSGADSGVGGSSFTGGSPSGGAATAGRGGAAGALGGAGTSAGGRAGSGGDGGAQTASGGSSSGGRVATSGGAGGAQSTGGASGSGTGCNATPDACPMPTGLSYACAQRFALGINYAWHNFAADFGGVAAWNAKSISQDPNPIDADLAAMHAAGVSVIRWWVFPDFRGDGVTFDGAGDPTGISTTAVADVGKALELAAKNDVYVVLTIFSFDDFRPDRTESGLFIRGMSPMVSSSTRRAKLTENVVRPLARAAAQSDNAVRLLGWDVINEPEWAVRADGNAPGGQDFTPNSELMTVTLDEMKSLIDESAAVLKQETPTSLTSVGWAAAKWAWAFGDVTSIDFNQPHIYGWVDQYWPYTQTPAELGYGTRPTVMGEFFLRPMPFSDGGDNAAFADIVGSWWDHGYAGAWAWQFADERQNLSLIQSFKAQKGCQAGF